MGWVCLVVINKSVTINEEAVFPSGESGGGFEKLGQSGLNYHRLPRHPQRRGVTGRRATQAKPSDAQAKPPSTQAKLHIPGKAARYLGNECCSRITQH